MKLEDIGFYSLTDERAKTATSHTPLWRNEVVITGRCNFNCPYCRGTEINGSKNEDMGLYYVKKTIDFFASERIVNIRFSGGEPTLHKNFLSIIKYTKKTCKNIEHIAVSTNGYSDIDYYKKMIDIGVNDFSISLDACCAATGDMMSGGISGAWEKVVDNIKALSKLTYVTVGIVFDKQNSSQISETIKFASSLGVADIRIISAAQWNDMSIFDDMKIPRRILKKHPILAYRINNFKRGRNVRGISGNDSNKCGLVLDDLVVKGYYHYPCVIKMREGSAPIGNINSGSVREDREKFYIRHNTFNDPVCRQNCLDVCVDYNNKHQKSFGGKR